MSRATLLRLISLASIFIVLGICAAVAYGVYQVVNYPFRGDPWTLDEINGLFKVSVPQDATDLQYSGYTGLGAHLDLTFNAPPASAEKFVSAICNSLYAGYDPFYSIEIAEPFSYTHLIEAGLVSYYSYSPDTPKTVLGNRCGGQAQVRVDEADPNIYRVKVQRFFSCNAVCYPIETKGTRPANSFPFELLGLEQVDNHYQVTANEFCAGVRGNLTSWSEFNQKNLANAQLQIMIDQRQIAAAQMDNNWGLFDRTDADGKVVEINTSGSQNYYCLKPDLEDGTHRIELRLQTATHKTLSYAWEVVSPAPQITAAAPPAA